MGTVDDKSKAELAAAWIAAERLLEKDSWAIQVLVDLPYQDPELCWEVVQLIYRGTDSDEVRGSLAAGPLEDLLVYHPEQFFPRVKALAIQDPNFRSMLASVWLDGNDSPIWEEFYKLAGVSPPFPPGWDKT